MHKTLLRIYQFSLLVARRFMADGSSQTAASLTYTSLLAIVPLLTLGITIVSAFPAFAQISLSLKSFLLQNMMPETASKVIRVYMLQFSQNAGKLTAIGTLALTVTALMLMQTIEHALNSIWHVRRQRPWTQRFLIYWSVLTLGPLLIGTSLYVTSYLASFAMGFTHDISAFKLFGLKLMPILSTVTALSLLYLTVPNRHVPTWHAWLGGLIGGSCFEVMKSLFSHYISHFASYTVIYGAFAALPLFLLWIYLSWMTVLFGATLTASLPYYRQPHLAHRPTPGSLFYVALQTLEHLAHAQAHGETLTVKQLADNIPAGWDDLENALALLTEMHWVLRSGKGWALARHPEHIVLRDAFERLVFEPQPQTYPLHWLTEQPKLSLAAWLALQTRSDLATQRAVISDSTNI